MKWPSAILHVDGDAFFASCEVARDPSLRGKPVVVGGVRGIALAVTYEAKALGVTRGMPAFHIRKMWPEVVILPGDYELYGRMAIRMYAIVRRFAGVVEEYSIDECFADVTNSLSVRYPTYELLASAVKGALESETGVSFSVGVAPSKVLAKVASKFRKPSGLVIMAPGMQSAFLEATPVGKLWGVGAATAAKLHTFGVTTAEQFVHQSEWWVKANLAKPHRDIWHELHGEKIFPVHSESDGEQKSVASTRTFRPPSADKTFLFAQLSKNVEEACARARMGGLRALRASAFIKSQEFQYRRFEVALSSPTNRPEEILRVLKPYFDAAYEHGVLCRATGVTLSDIRVGTCEQLDLFGEHAGRAAGALVYEALDSVRARFGKGSIVLASSLSAYEKRERSPTFKTPLFGEVS